MPGKFDYSDEKYASDSKEQKMQKMREYLYIMLAPGLEVKDQNLLNEYLSTNHGPRTLMKQILKKSGSWTECKKFLDSENLKNIIVKEIQRDRKAHSKALEAFLTEELQLKQVYPWQTLRQGGIVLDDYNRQDKYGPDVAPDGTPREDFYDAMLENGWDLRRDEYALNAIYNIAVYSMKQPEPDMNFLKDLMKSPAKSAAERNVIREKMILTAKSLYKKENRVFGHQLTLDNSKDYYRFHERMRAKGWTAKGDEKILDAIFYYQNNAYSRSVRKNIRDLALDDYLYMGNDNDHRLRAINDLIDTKTLAEKDPELSKYVEEQKKILTEIKEAAEREAELKAYPKLRNLFKWVIENGLDEIDDFKIPVEPNYFRKAANIRFAHIEPDQAAKDSLKAIVDSLPIDEELVKKGPDAIVAAIQGDFDKHIDEKFAATDYMDQVKYINPVILKGLNTPEEIRQKILSKAIEDMTAGMKIEAANAERAQDPKAYIRAEKILTSIKDLGVIIKTLKSEENKEFYEKAKANGGVADDIPVHYINLRTEVLNPKTRTNFERLNDAESEELHNVIKKASELDIKKPEELMTAEDLNDPFWDKLSDNLVTDLQISKLQKVFTRLDDKGLDWNEFKETGTYKDFIARFNIAEGGRYDPFDIAKMACGMRSDVNELKATCSSEAVEQAINCLEQIEKAVTQQKESLYDMKTESIGIWLATHGFDLLKNSVMVANGFEEKEIDGKKVPVISFSTEIDEKSIDRDKMHINDYREMVDAAREAQELYNANKYMFDKFFDNVYTHRNYQGGALMNVIKNYREADNDLDTSRKLNRFRHLLYKLKAADKNVCKLVDIKNDKSEIMVDPLPEDTKFDKAMVNKEVELLNKCIEMLKEPAERVHRNSSEYVKIMESIQNLKTSLKQGYPDDETARKEYIKHVTKILNNINRYRVHKAVDGVKNDATHDKIVAAERVEKFLSIRFRTLEKKEYMDNLEGVADLFNVEVEDKNLTGDDYLLANGKGKIENMRRNIDRIKQELDKGEGKNRRNTVGGINNNNAKAHKVEEKQRNSQI